MKCPACNKEADKLMRGGLCPNQECKAPLKRVMRDDVNGVPVEMWEFRKPKDVKTEDYIESYITTFSNQDVKVECTENKANFIVTFYKKMNNCWIYCPSCESKMFQSNILFGSQENKCHKCKAVTTYVFR